MLLSSFFRSFFNITFKFSGSIYVTSRLYFHEMCSICSDLTPLIERADDCLLSKMATSTQKKDKHWGSVDNFNIYCSFQLFLIHVIS